MELCHTENVQKKLFEMVKGMGLIIIGQENELVAKLFHNLVFAIRLKVIHPSNMEESL